MIGVFGGTFDPVHYGHLRPALEVKQVLGMRQVRFIPCHIPPHRGAPGASASQRMTMLQLALEGVPGFVADERELVRGGPSFMVDTLLSLREEQGDEPMALMLGQDAFARLDTWHQWPRLLTLAHIVVARRPGGALPVRGPVADLLACHRARESAQLQTRPSGKIWTQDVTQLDISATTIRAGVKDEGGCRFLTPEPVREYVEAHGLYLTTSN